jgi:hypothetical protein
MDAKPFRLAEMPTSSAFRDARRLRLIRVGSGIGDVAESAEAQ